MSNKSKAGSEEPGRAGPHGVRASADAAHRPPQEDESLAAMCQAAAEPLRAARCPDLGPAIMARIAELEAARATETQELPARGLGPARRLLDWLWLPRPMTVSPRPVHALAAAALVLAFALAPWPDERTGALQEPGTVAAAAEAAPIYVQFRLDAAHASRVALAGSFTNWQPRVELRQMAPGVWSAMVPLEPGVHDYLFVVDSGDWVPDPHAGVVEDGFGGVNSRIALLPHAGQRL